MHIGPFELLRKSEVISVNLRAGNESLKDSRFSQLTGSSKIFLTHSKQASSHQSTCHFTRFLHKVSHQAADFFYFLHTDRKPASIARLKQQSQREWD